MCLRESPNLWSDQQQRKKSIKEKKGKKRWERIEEEGGKRGGGNASPMPRRHAILTGLVAVSQRVSLKNVKTILSSTIK